MKKLLLLTVALALASPCMAQTIAPSSYVGGLTSTDGLNWDPLTSTLTTGPIAPNTYGGLLGYNSSTLQWYPCSVASPCLGAGGGGGGGGPVLETNGVANTSQTLLNLIQGTNITLTNSGGGVTINSTAGGITQLTGAVLAGPGSGSVASTIANLGASGNLPMSNGSGTFTPSGITFDSLGDMNDINSFDGLLGLTVLNTDCTVNSGTAIELAGENTGGNGGLFLQHNTSCYSGTNPNMTNISGPSINSIYSEDGLPFWIIGELGGAISLGDGTDQPNLVVNHVGQIAGGSGVALSYFGTTSANGMAGGILASLPSTAPGGGAGVPGEVVLATTAQKTITLGSTALVLGSTVTSVAGLAVNGVTLNSTGSSSLFLTQAGTYASASGSTGISGATAGQALIAGSATTATSSIAINGVGAGLVTGPSAPTSGDVAFFTGGAGAITDGLIAGANLVTAASALTANQIVLGAGSKTTAVLGSLGTTTTVLHGNASGAPSFGAVALSTDVTGILAIADGGTGAATAAQNSVFAGPATGGAGAPSYQTAPTFAVTNLTGTGGFSITGNATTATSATTATNLSGGLLGSIPYQSAANTTAFVAPNTTTARLFSSETGTGTVGAAPTLGLIGAADTGPSAYVVTTGAVNVLVATMSPAVPSLVAGLEIDILPNLANTSTTPTINVNGLGAKTITKNGTGALVAGDLSTTAIASLVYDGTEFQLVNPQIINATSVGGKLPSGSGTAIATANNSGMVPLELACFTNTGTAQLGQCGGGVLVGSENVVTFSTTPTFATTSLSNIITLTAPVTSSTWAAVTDAIPRTITICQDATGSRTFVPPANTHGFMTIGTTASLCSSQSFTYSVAKTGWYATSTGVINE